MKQVAGCQFVVGCEEGETHGASLSDAETDAEQQWLFIC